MDGVDLKNEILEEVVWKEFSQFLVLSGLLRMVTVEDGKTLKCVLFGIL